MAHKISIENYTKFRNRFYSGGFPHLRFGQAFINHFGIKGPHPELFYERDDSKAVTIIFDQYIEN
jgi:hypothetical protein